MRRRVDFRDRAPGARSSRPPPGLRRGPPQGGGPAFDPLEADVSSLHREMLAGRLTARELAARCLERISALDAFLATRPAPHDGHRVDMLLEGGRLWPRSARRLETLRESARAPEAGAPPPGAAERSGALRARLAGLFEGEGFAASGGPLGIEFASPAGGEASLLRIATAYEAATRHWRPPAGARP